MGKENPNFLRRAEPKAEKVGGGLLAILGAISLEAPVVAGGIVLYLIGKWREPKQQTQAA